MVADRTTDVVIIGGGPAGAAVALQLLDRGISPIIVERESSQVSHRGIDDRGVRRPGAWPGLRGADDRGGAPVKHGVVVFGTRGNADWWVPVIARREGLHDRVTWQVRRSIFDRMMLDAALGRAPSSIAGRATDPIVERTGL